MTAYFFGVIEPGETKTLTSSTPHPSIRSVNWLLLREYASDLEVLALDGRAFKAPFGQPLVWKDSPGSYAIDAHTPIARIPELPSQRRGHVLLVRNPDSVPRQFEGWLREKRGGL